MTSACEKTEAAHGSARAVSPGGELCAWAFAPAGAFAPGNYSGAGLVTFTNLSGARRVTVGVPAEAAT